MITADSLENRGTQSYCPRCRAAQPYPGCCDSCGHAYSNHMLGLVISRNGVHQYRRRCWACGHHSETIKQKDVSPLAHVELLSDNRCEWCEGVGCNACNPTPCARCGSHANVQYHHWAPRALFPDGEADKWPISPLCQACHSIWHRVVTPVLRRQPGEVA